MTCCHIYFIKYWNCIVSVSINNIVSYHRRGNINKRKHVCWFHGLVAFFCPSVSCISCFNKYAYAFSHLVSDICQCLESEIFCFMKRYKYRAFQSSFLSSLFSTKKQMKSDNFDRRFWNQMIINTDNFLKTNIRLFAYWSEILCPFFIQDLTISFD